MKRDGTRKERELRQRDRIPEVLHINKENVERWRMTMRIWSSVTANSIKDPTKENVKKE